MAENFDLIFGQSASSQYAWNDSDYQNGWETVGSTPPTAEQFDALQRRNDKKAQELNNALTPLVNQNTASNRQPLTAYALNDIRYYNELPVGWYLECTTAGTSASGDITLPSQLVENATITDGTCVWKVRKISSADGMPIGAIIAFGGNGNIPSGYLLCDGAAYSRTAFPDLFACIGTDYGSGDGSTTFNVPDANQAKRFLQGDVTAGQVKDAGLPNITGQFYDVAHQGTGSGSLYADAGAGTHMFSLGTDPAYQEVKVHLDASRSNSIYGNSTTVQPDALTTRYIIKAFDGQTADSALVDITQYEQAVADARVPIGMMLPCATETARKNFLLCDGSAVSRDTYSALFAVIGTKYGAGDGSTTFNLPDYNVSGRFVQGDTVAGTVKSAGLPNITGAAWGLGTSATIQSGALYFEQGSSSYSLNNTGINRDGLLRIDASRSSAIYGNSTTVQPPALTACWQIKYC